MVLDDLTRADEDLRPSVQPGFDAQGDHEQCD
jgi:hypothetical protein